LFQRVPEVYEPAVSLDEALSFHGLTRAKMSSEMIRWVESIRLESPELHRAILYDPPHIKRGMEIRIWDFVFSTSMTTDYPVRRGWNDFMAIREFLQNSLAYSEPILVMENGEVKLEKIGDFVEKHLKEGETEGKVDGVYALSFVPNHRGKGWVLRWLPITRVYKHRFNGDMFKVTLETGRSISVTGAHSLFKLYKREVGKNELHAVPISTKYYPYATYGGLHAGDLVALPFTRMEPAVNEEIDLLEELAKLPESITEHIDLDGSQYFLSNKFEVDKDQMKCNRVPLNLWRKFKYPLPKGIALSGKRSPSKIKRMLPVRPFLRFLGFYMAEGCIPKDNDRRPYIILSFGSHESKLIREVEEILGELGEISYSICRPHETAVNIEVYSEPLAIYLEHCLKVGANSLEKKLPNILFNMNWPLVKEFLNCYFKGDGYHHNRMNRWVVSTSSGELATGLIYLLSLNQVSFSLEEKEEREVEIGDRRVTQEKTYCFYIYEGALSGKRGGRASRRQNGDLTFLRVIKIEPREYNHQWVYDVSVPEAENFVAGTGCFMVHNSLDIEERTFGYEGIEVGVWVDTLGLHISDRGPGITYESFRLGASDKKCDERGFFGEGLKVAMAHLVQRGCPVYVFNRRGQVFKAFVSPGTSLVLIAMGRFTKHVSGTEVVVYGLPEMRSEWADPAYVRRIIFKEWMKDPNLEVLTVKRWKTDACPSERPNFIVSAKNGVNVDFLWVRDIVVNKISTITRLPSVFGYNLWWPTLEPNRVAVSSVPELSREAAKAFDEAAVRALLDRVVEEVRVKKGLFETEQIDWWYAADEAKNEAARWVKEKGFGVTDNEKALDWALYLGVIPLIVTWNMKPLFTKAPSLEMVLAERSLERLATAEQNIVPPETLSLRERCILRAAEIVMEAVHVSLRGNKELAPKVFVTKMMPGAEGTLHYKKIYILRRTLRSFEEAIECVLHEYSHYYGRETYGAARDLSENFEKALGTVAATAALLPMDDKFAVRRAMSGAWGARSIEWVEDRYITRAPIFISLQKAINEAVESVGIPPSIYLSDSQRYHVDYNAPLIICVSLTPDQVSNLKKGIALTLTGIYLDTSYRVGDIMEYWNLPFADINLYKATLEKELTKILERTAKYKEAVHIILLYNPEKDIYEVWRVIPRQT
jgi:intein/homing endonuclease